eukprot:9260952-Ditylum_brightwellii.AAC.1
MQLWNLDSRTSHPVVETTNDFPLQSNKRLDLLQQQPLGYYTEVLTFHYVQNENSPDHLQEPVSNSLILHLLPCGKSIAIV